jgi:hypothetical protein
MKRRRNPRGVGNHQFAAGVGATVAAALGADAILRIYRFVDFGNQRFCLFVPKK